MNFFNLFLIYIVCYWSCFLFCFFKFFSSFEKFQICVIQNEKNEKHLFVCFKLGIIYLIFQEFGLIFKCMLPFGKFIELKKGALSKSNVEKYFECF